MQTDMNEPAGLRVAYLVNQYPKVSHSFIRREILALERHGVSVERFAVRGWGDEFPDAPATGCRTVSAASSARR